MILLLHCRDDLYKDSPAVDRNSIEFFQRRLMMNTLNFPSPHRLREMRIISGDANGQDVCQWRGVTCDEDTKIVCGLRWNGDGEDSMDINSLTTVFLPSTIRTLFLVNIWGARYFRLITRALPRAATNIHVLHCGLGGTIDLRALPKRLVTLEMTANQLSGTACLIDLPTTLKVIDLTENHITSVFVDSMSLPKCFEVGIFSNPRSREQMTVIEMTGAELDMRIRVEYSDGQDAEHGDEASTWSQCSIQ